MGGAYSEELLKLYIDKGMTLILAGNDLPMLTAAARAHEGQGADVSEVTFLAARHFAPTNLRVCVGDHHQRTHPHRPFRR
jgi:hypothetical protein